MKLVIKKFIKTIFFITITANLLYSQEDKFKEILTKPSAKSDCETASSNVELQIDRMYKNDSIVSLLNVWKGICGNTEPIMRLEILLKIGNSEDTDSIIFFYFRNYSNVIISRIKDSKEINSRRIYDDSKKYYSFIPLNGNFDNRTKKLAIDLLSTMNLSADEKLVCTLFAFKLTEYENLLDEKEFRNTNIVEYNNALEVSSEDAYFYKILLGGWMPINDPNNIFGLNPQIGASVGVEGEKFQMELLLNLRINVNANNFEIDANSEIIETDTDLGFLIAAKVGYQVYKKRNVSIYPNLSLGWDIIDTDVKKNNAEEDDTYYDLGALSFGVGLGFYYDVFKKNQIGLELNYHYVPYTMDSNYYTQFSSDYLIFNLVYKF